MGESENEKFLLLLFGQLLEKLGLFFFPVQHLVTLVTVRQSVSISYFVSFGCQSLTVFLTPSLTLVPFIGFTNALGPLPQSIVSSG